MLGGGPVNRDAAARLDRTLVAHLGALSALSPAELVEDHYRRFRSPGAFVA